MATPAKTLHQPPFSKALPAPIFFRTAAMPAAAQYPRHSHPWGEFVYAFWNDHEEAEEPGPKRRVIDVAKESLALMSEALETLGDAFAIYGFSGYGRQDVEFHVAKEFNERLSSRSWAAIASVVFLW
jgi:hypothetical protein